MPVKKKEALRLLEEYRCLQSLIEDAKQLKTKMALTVSTARLIIRLLFLDVYDSGKGLDAFAKQYNLPREDVDRLHKELVAHIAKNY